MRALPEDAYINYLRKQAGWNPDWDQYAGQFAQKLVDPDYDVINPIKYPDFKPVSQDAWTDITDWYGGKAGTDFKNWTTFKDSYGQKPTPPLYPNNPLSRAGQYVNYASNQAGWNPEWDRYIRRLTYKLENPDDIVTNNISATNGGVMAGIPQVDWSAMVKFAEGLDPMAADTWGYKEENIIPW